MLGLVEGLGDLEVLAELAVLADGALEEGKEGTEEGKSGYPVLAAYVRDMYPRVKDTVDWASYRQYYRWAVGVAKDEPLPDLEQIRASADAPHGREGL